MRRDSHLPLTVAPGGEGVGPGSPHSGSAPWLGALSQVSRGQARQPGLLTQQPAVCPSAALPPLAGAPSSHVCLPPTVSTPASVPPGPCSVARGCWGPGSPQVEVFTGALGPERGGRRASAHVSCLAGASVPRPHPAPMSIALWAAAVPMLGAGWPLVGVGAALSECLCGGQVGAWGYLHPSLGESPQPGVQGPGQQRP